MIPEKGYEVCCEITSMRDVKNLIADENAMLFLGGAPWHGNPTNNSLDDVERILRGEDEKWLPDGAYITVFILNMKDVSIHWGEINVKSLAEANYLRGEVVESLNKINDSQKGSGYLIYESS